MSNNYKNKYLSEKYKFFELKNHAKDLQEEITHLKNQIDKIAKENEHFKSSKAYKVWNKYRDIKDQNNDLDYKKHDKIKNPHDIKVALISDQFTYDSYKYEFEIIEISPENWLEQFKKEKPELFFCESAWQGYCFGQSGAWAGKIEKLDENGENRAILFDILKYCNEKNIPTIFWNKEDPVYYSSSGKYFTDTATRFDYIFTSAEETIKDYKKDYNHPNVYSLMFAGQPKLFNPLNLSDEEINDVVFAGSYYKHHEERMKNSDLIFDKIISQNINLRIYDRTYNENIAHIGFPEKYKKYTLPSIDYKDTSKIYKKMKWGININTITKSETMFARRVFELALTNTNIISNYSLGMKEIFKNNIFIIEDDDFPILTEPYEEKRLNNLYNSLENHTYAKRWKQILDTINFPYKEENKEITVIFLVESEKEIENAYKKYNEINYSQKRLKLILEDELDIDNIKNKYPLIKMIYTKTDEYKEDISKNIESEYYIIANNNLNTSFIKKAILHFEYLNKNYGIKEGEEKFKLGCESDIENIVFNKKTSNLNKKFYDVYYI
ncbi:hypothetical protein LJB96_00445 [Methanobrevibacter sp. OttesenSCG-928-K11]|nr:hypothetical protein [Methanobrevibacter sp. OttesenSCG-928-K11]MDL2270387.1 hypothetical protein [Methanobrevibacter sp. OttesenSCG-928-I08]